jgi:hypothetical protein
MDGLSTDGRGLSLAWRCFDCGRLLLGLQPSPPPDRCIDCGGERIESVGPPHDPRGTYRNVSWSVLTWPFVERRRGPRS